MNKAIAAITVTVSLVVALGVGYFLYGFKLYQDRLHWSSEWSESPSESARRGLFLGRYVALKDSVRLRDGSALAVPGGWAEREWGYDVSATFRRTFKQGDRFQLLFPRARPDTMSLRVLMVYGGDYATEYVRSTARGHPVTYSGYTQGLRVDPVLHVAPTWFALPVDTLRVEVWEERVPGGGLGGAGDRVSVDTAVWVFRPVVGRSGT